VRKEQAMFEKILFPTDGSEIAQGALPLAKQLARVNHSELIVAHVDQLLIGRAGGYSTLSDEEETCARVKRVVKDLQEEGFNATFSLTTRAGGSISSAIADLAALREVDLIVIGTHARGVVGTAVHGSVAKRLLHAAPCPVLVAPVTNAGVAVAPHDTNVGALV
jgi:nucleotide-binding universal stress UspA family protein